MRYTAGIDVGSTYTKAMIVDQDHVIRGRAARPTGFQLAEAAEQALREACEAAGIPPSQVAYSVATGFGRHQVAFVDLKVTDLTAAARGAGARWPCGRTSRMRRRWATWSRASRRSSGRWTS